MAAQRKSAEAATAATAAATATATAAAVAAVAAHAASTANGRRQGTLSEWGLQIGHAFFCLNITLTRFCYRHPPRTQSYRLSAPQHHTTRCTAAAAAAAAERGR
jgi:hypothetical protein